MGKEIFIKFLFKFLHRILVTKKELFKFRLADDETCFFCSNQDSIEHIFLECFVTKSFYSEALTWFNHVNNTDVCLSNKQIALNDIPGLQQLTDYPRRRLHLVVILLKQYIYACKYLEKKPTIKEFQSKVLLHWQIEKCALP